MVSALVDFSIGPSFLLVNVMMVSPLTTLYPCVKQYPFVFNFYSWLFPVFSCPPYFFWCPLFDINGAFVAIRVLIFSITILFVSDSCLMLIVIWVSTSFSEVMSIARLFSAATILSWIMMAMSNPWNPTWVTLMHYSSKRSWYSSENNFLKSAHVFSYDSFLRHIFLDSIYMPLANTVL